MSSSLVLFFPAVFLEADISSTFQFEPQSCTTFSSHASDAEVSPAIPRRF